MGACVPAEKMRQSGTTAQNKVSVVFGGFHLRITTTRRQEGQRESWRRLTAGLLNTHWKTGELRYRTTQEFPVNGIRFIKLVYLLTESVHAKTPVAPPFASRPRAKLMLRNMNERE